jgi:aminoglycoside phosphotransferase (APT) family kinase protein
MSIQNHERKKVQESINWETLVQYLRTAINGLPEGILEVQKFSEGYSNLTYLLRIGDWEAVLRRPPLGKMPPKAHDMQREYQILEKVNPVFNYAPKPYVYCEDPSIMDKHFYVMEKKQGIVIDDQLPEQYNDPEFAGPLISKSVIKTLVELQSVNYKTAGLQNMGKPEGFLERQVYNWIKRYDLAKTEEISQINELENWLKGNIPNNSETTIVHNDFKLNNMIFDKNDPSIIVGILDWELSTIGDPLSDLGATVAYWGQPNDPDMGINIITDQKGFYSRREFIEEYAKLSRRDVSNVAYYVTFSFYKLAVILQQIHHRWKIGAVQDERFGNLNKAVANLVEMANLTRKNQLI